MDKKKLRNDIILIVSLLLVVIIPIVIIFATRKKDNLVAKVYVQNDLVETIDLSNHEERTYRIKGIQGYATISTKDGGVAIIESDCPHQDCVHMGYVYTTNRPIICAPLGIYVYIVGEVINDVEAG